ncbi:MAG TPA: response regulator [Burkholderiales bacterium]|nr:response regulator [Burkholderiales bacterium]
MSRILLVDDNADALSAIVLLLGHWGHEVREAHDGPSALLIARAWHPDIVLLDIGLPGMDRFRVAAALRRDAAREPPRIIAMSGLYGDDDEAMLAAVGIDQILRKPLDTQFLRSLFGHAARQAH